MAIKLKHNVSLHRSKVIFLPGRVFCINLYAPPAATRTEFGRLLLVVNFFSNLLDLPRRTVDTIVFWRSCVGKWVRFKEFPVPLIDMP